MPSDWDDSKVTPMAVLHETAGKTRSRPADPRAAKFPFLDDMRAEGVTDYYAAPLLFADGSIHSSSWTTRQPGGSSDGQLDGLRTLLVQLARLIAVLSLRLGDSTLLGTDVRHRAGGPLVAA